MPKDMVGVTIDGRTVEVEVHRRMALFGQPRVKPPFPAIIGAFGAPTVINNVETLCNIPHIMIRGADWFLKIGTDERNTGPKLYCISGHVERPGVYEFPIGVSLDGLLDAAGGMLRGRELKAFIPGGASAAMFRRVASQGRQP